MILGSYLVNCMMEKGMPQKGFEPATLDSVVRWLTTIPLCLVVAVTDFVPYMTELPCDGMRPFLSPLRTFSRCVDYSMESTKDVFNI